MDASTHYADAWESFWQDAPAGEQTVLWDAPPEATAALHLPLLSAHSPGGLPLVDIGCGNGTQTRFLAQRYGRAVGIDVSAAAIALALDSGGGHADPDGPDGPAGSDGPDFRRMDATDAAAVRGLHEELGDADVYVRGVLHQCGPRERARIAACVAVLTGGRGRALVVEPGEAAKEVLMGLMRRPEGPPPSLAAVFEHGIAPTEMLDDTVPAYFAEAGLDVLARGQLPLALTVRKPDGSPLTLPANWLVVGQNG